MIASGEAPVRSKAGALLSPATLVISSFITYNCPTRSSTVCFLPVSHYSFSVLPFSKLSRLREAPTTRSAQCERQQHRYSRLLDFPRLPGILRPLEVAQLMPEGGQMSQLNSGCARMPVPVAPLQGWCKIARTDILSRSLRVWRPEESRCRGQAREGV